MVAFQAYKQGLYGDYYVWVFPRNRDIIYRPDDDSCTVEQRIEFAKGVFTQFAEILDLDDHQLSIGLTSVQIQQKLSEKLGIIDKKNFRNSHTCFDLFVGSILLLDATEKRLISVGSSLRHFISNESMKLELEDVVRQAVADLDLSLFVGPVKYEQTERFVKVPGGFEQIQGEKSKRKIVICDNAQFDDPERFSFVNPIIWRTPKNIKPNDEPSVNRQVAKAHTIAVVIYTLITSISILILIYLSIFVLIRNRKTTIGKLTLCSFFGMFLLELCLLLFPFISVATYCSMAPVLALFGYFLIMWSIIEKLYSKTPLAEYVFKSGSFHKVRRVSKRPDQNLIFSPKIWTTLIVCLSLISILFIAWYSVAGIPTVQTLTMSTYDLNTDTTNDNIQEHCSSSANKLLSYIFSGCLAGFLGIGLINLIITAVLKRNGGSASRKPFVMEAYCVIPAMISIVLALSLGLHMVANYYILVPIVQANVAGFIALEGFHQKVFSLK